MRNRFFHAKILRKILAKHNTNLYNNKSLLFNPPSYTFLKAKHRLGAWNFSLAYALGLAPFNCDWSCSGLHRFHLQTAHAVKSIPNSAY